MNLRFTRLLTGLAILLASAPDVKAQTSQLMGEVKDATGAVVPGAAVVVENAGTGVVVRVTTNDVGLYRVPLLLPGKYNIAVEKEGFRPLRQEGLVLETATTRTVDLVIELGAVSESVTVSSAAPLLESQTSSVGQFVERASIFNMPLGDRRAAVLTRLMGNVSFNPASGAVVLMSVAGGRARNQMFNLDGTSAQNNSVDVPQLTVHMSADAMQEFKLEQNNYSAEHGRNAGGIILMTTRSGTNEFHGAAYEFLRNDALDARTFFASSKAPLRYNIFGASVGGPMVRNKAFFFFNYEGRRRRDGATYRDTVPREAEVRGDFSQRRDVLVRDPLTRQPFAGNVIPASRIDPLGQKLASLYPRPNTASDPTRAPFVNHINNAAPSQTWDVFTGRADYYINDTNRIYGRLTDPWVRGFTPPVFPNEFADPRAGRNGWTLPNWTFNWVHNFTPTLIQEMRLGGETRIYGFFNRSLGTGTNKNAELGIRGVAPDTFSQIGVAGITGLGRASQDHLQRPIIQFHFVDHYTWIKNKHQIKTGFEIRYSGFKLVQRDLKGGSFNFGLRATGDGLAELLLGHVNSASLLDADPRYVRSNYYGAFIQDDWKVTPSFTLNLGLRWEMDTPRWETRGRQSGFDPYAINPVCNCPGVVTFAGQNGLGKYPHDFDKNNFGPRFGFAWSGRQGMVIRGGYGISYNGLYATDAIRIMSLGFSHNGDFVSPDGGLTQAFRLQDGMPVIAREPLTASFGAVRVGQQPRVSVDFLQKDHVTGYAQHWNLGIQKQLPANVLFEITYLANVGHKLGGVNASINQVPLVNGRGPAVQSQALRPFPQFSDVVLANPPWGNSTYHSMNLKLEKRYSHGMNFLMNYTWSKFLDDIEPLNEIGGAPGNGYQHIELRRLDKSYSGNDIRHRYVGSMVYDLPFGKSRKYAINNRYWNAIAGGWGLGAIAEFRTGVPFGVVRIPNVTNTFSASQRPNILGEPKQLPDWRQNVKANPYFDPALFQAPGVGVFGNAARNVGFGPGYIGIDVSVNKWWNVTERYRMQFRSDFYNLPNHPNFAAPAGSHGAPAGFGMITNILGGSTGRQVELALRVEW